MSFSAHPAYSFCLRQFVVRVARSQLFAVVVALLPRRRPVLLAIVGVVIRVRPVGSSVVDRFVDRFAAHRLLAPFCLSEGGEAWRGGFSPVPCGLLLGVSLSCPSSFSRDGGASRLVRLFACRFGILRVMALSLAWRVVAAFPPSPVARAVCLCGQGYPSGLPFLRLVSSFASPPCACLAACGGRGRLVPAFRSPSIRISPRPSCRGGGAIFLFLSALSVVPLIDEECGHITGHDTRHGVRRIIRPVLNLVAGRLGLHEIVGRGDELVVHAVEGLADGRTDTTDIHELGSALDYLIESGLIGIATVVLCEDVSDLDVLDALHGVVLSFGACSLSTSIEYHGGRELYI